MPTYRRAQVVGGVYLFTVNLVKRRGNDQLVCHIDALRDAVRRTRPERPFAIDAWVVHPEHIELGTTGFVGRRRGARQRPASTSYWYIA